MNKLSDRLSILYKEYPGDDAWRKYVSNFSDLDKSILLGLGIDEDIAKAIAWHVGNKYVENWLKKEIPGLDNNTPLDILKLKEGKIILRSAIMRMP